MASLSRQIAIFAIVATSSAWAMEPILLECHVTVRSSVNGKDQGVIKTGITSYSIDYDNSTVTDPKGLVHSATVTQQAVIYKGDLGSASNRLPEGTTVEISGRVNRVTGHLEELWVFASSVGKVSTRTMATTEGVCEAVKAAF